MAGTVEHLKPGELGTKEYWEEAYTREIANYTASTDDEGTVWFSDANAEDRIVKWLEQACDGELDGVYHLVRTGDDGTTTSFLDLGTGNGHMLFSLREEDWQGSMVGVDYSWKSVQLARQILENKTAAGSYEGIQFEEYDLLASQATKPTWIPHDGFDVVLDKGTFDAISLSSEIDAAGHRASEGYAEKIEPFIKVGGLFIITSCNWTADEVRHWFERPDGKLKYSAKVRYPSFTFGGKSGSQVCTLIFEKT